jgi:hypothetical protein
MGERNLIYFAYACFMLHNDEILCPLLLGLPRTLSKNPFSFHCSSEAYYGREFSIVPSCSLPYHHIPIGSAAGKNMTSTP